MTGQPEIEHLIAGTWNAPRQVLRTILDLDPDPAATAEMLDAVRADEALALWMAAQLRAGSAFHQIRARLDDAHWPDEIALTLVDVESFGAVSMGTSTRRTLRTLAAVLTVTPVVYVASSVIARGLEDLPVELRFGGPAHAAVTLVPVAARFGPTVWTSAAGASAVAGSATALVVDPLTVLDEACAGRYRPRSWLTACELPD